MGDRVRVRSATGKDLVRISENLRDCDLREIKAFAGTDPLTALVTSKLHSDSTMVALVDNEPVLIIGFADTGSIMKPCGTPWVVATERIAEVSVKVLRDSREHTRRALNRYGFLQHWVDSENLTSIKWLKWLGFTVEEDRFMDTGGRRFYYFSQTKQEA